MRLEVFSSKAQVEMIRSPLVLAPVISRPEAAEVPELQDEEDPTELAGQEH